MSLLIAKVHLATCEGARENEYRFWYMKVGCHYKKSLKYGSGIGIRIWVEAGEMVVEVDVKDAAGKISG